MKHSSACSKRAHVNALFMKQFAQQARRIMTSSKRGTVWFLHLALLARGEKMQPHMLKKQNWPFILLCYDATLAHIFLYIALYLFIPTWHKFLFFYQCWWVVSFFLCIYNRMKEMYKTSWEYTTLTLSTDTIWSLCTSYQHYLTLYWHCFFFSLCLFHCPFLHFYELMTHFGFGTYTVSPIATLTADPRSHDSQLPSGCHS